MAELIVAMDVPDSQTALSLATELEQTVSWLKIGLELFIGAGPDLLLALREKKFKIFLDLKFYDIPNTVGRAVLATAAHHVQLLTLHAQGGRRMCEAAVEAVAPLPKKERPLLFGVTALTSFADGEMPGIEKDCAAYGAGLASLARAWGLDGVVCSGHEAKAIKRQNPGLLCLCPGIRPERGAEDDQRRVMTPEEAVKAGADFLVVGRPILRASSPGRAAMEILERMKKTGNE